MTAGTFAPTAGRSAAELEDAGGGGHVDERMLAECQFASDRLPVVSEWLSPYKAGVVLSDAGYVECIDDNLLPTVSRDQFEADLRKGDGNELEAKFLAVHSSSALGVNCFAPFKIAERARELTLAGVTGFEAIKFEKKCPTGLRRGKPPNLDLVCECRTAVVAVESKCTEYLGTRVSRPFSTAYSTEILDDRRNGPWFASMKAITCGEVKFRYLDAPQLIKHAFGLARCFRGMPTVLLYVFWEPTDAIEFPIFAKHREEIRRFREMVGGGFLSLFR